MYVYLAEVDTDPKAIQDTYKKGLVHLSREKVRDASVPYVPVIYSPPRVVKSCRRAGI